MPEEQPKRKRGGSGPARRGVAFERWMVAWLRERKYIATRTPGSHGAFDVVALRAGESLLAQCKKRDKPTADEMESLLDAAEIAGAVPLIVYWKRGSFDAFRVTESLEEKPYVLA
jgi:Holliday junction resolvase